LKKAGRASGSPKEAMILSKVPVKNGTTYEATEAAEKNSVSLRKTLPSKR
jgi:hypothetical protein